MSDIQPLAQQWLKLDQNPKTKAEIQSLLDAHNDEELSRRLLHPIEFGTAGLRARMEAGFSRMNDLTVICASQGLASYIVSTSSVAQRSVVIGHDHRHNSSRFARLTAAAMISTGIKVYFYDQLAHTPLVPFGVDLFKASAGVMITASHNPAMDNGYKVYWGNGCQIIPPHDSNIAKAIKENSVPICWDESLVDTSELVEKPLEQVKREYFTVLKKIARKSENKSLKFVYTPMHGVGLPFMTESVVAMGLTDGMVVVKEQAHPDPDFPTVRFPNPEEKGALDLAMSTADRHGINLVVASDPDADRFAAAERLRDSGEWRILSGNEMGILFAAHVLEEYREKNGSVEKLAMLCSTVSSQMLKTIAEVEGFKFEDTLTGFKWMGNRALDLQSQGYDAEYAFEEAIGYMFSPVVHDKDGIAAATVFLSMAQRWSTTGLTPYEKLQQLYKKYGYFSSANSYLISKEPALTKSVFEQIRAVGNPHPEKIGKRKIMRWRDLTVGFDSATSDGRPLLPVSTSSEMITCELEGDVRFTVRGSGTEPKIKLYIECRAESAEVAREGAKEVEVDLVREWFRPDVTGLVVP